MNLNLLPDKYIKNRAPMLLLIGYVIFVGVTLTLIMLFFGLLTISVTKQRNLVSQKKIEQVELTKGIKTLKNANSIEVQEAIKRLKQKQIMTNQVVKKLDEAFDKTGSVLWTYELNLMDSKPIDAIEKTFDNKELITVDISGAALYYNKQGAQKVIANLEAIPWVYSALIVSSSLHEEGDDLLDSWSEKEGGHDLTIKVKLIKEALPSKSRDNG